MDIRTSTIFTVIEENRVLKITAEDTEEKINKIEIIDPNGSVIFTKEYSQSVHEELEQIANN